MIDQQRKPRGHRHRPVQADVQFTAAIHPQCSGQFQIERPKTGGDPRGLIPGLQPCAQTCLGQLIARLPAMNDDPFGPQPFDIDVDRRDPERVASRLCLAFVGHRGQLDVHADERQFRNPQPCPPERPRFDLQTARLQVEIGPLLGGPVQSGDAQPTPRRPRHCVDFQRVEVTLGLGDCPLHTARGGSEPPCCDRCREHQQHQPPAEDQGQAPQPDQDVDKQPRGPQNAAPRPRCKRGRPSLPSSGWATSRRTMPTGDRQRTPRPAPVLSSDLGSI